MTSTSHLTLLVFFLLLHTLVFAKEELSDNTPIDDRDLKDYPMVIWTGMEAPVFTYEQVAAYCAPILWFSPDEPILEGTSGKDIMVPTSFPFEDSAETPIVYYRFRRILTRGGIEMDPIRHNDDLNKTKIDFGRIDAIDLDFFFYYPFEEGFGSHPHDCESTQMKVVMLHYPESEKYRYVLAIVRIIGKAHMNLWYDNTLDPDKHTVFPIHMMVEEGKHASCPDKNADGYYTPGSDVNKRVNDAWGVRDVMASGVMYTGNYEAWMAKKRRPEQRVFPPLPQDSPHYKKYVKNGVYAPDNNIYQLRPFPGIEQAEPSLQKVMKIHGVLDWPQIEAKTEYEELVEWFEIEKFINSYSLSLRAQEQVGLSLILPLFVFRHFEEPLSGGFILNRIYVKSFAFDDIGYNLLFTPSASRWFDTYFAAGAEWIRTAAEDGSSKRKQQFVTEAGVKFRFNIRFSKLKFLTKLGTDFYGVRFGVQNIGAWDIRNMGYVVEVGAGVW
jgi:hypothetical protein